MSSGRRYYTNNYDGTSTATNTHHNNRRYYQTSNSMRSNFDEEKEEMNFNDENAAQPGLKNHHHSSYHFQQKSSASTTTAKELLHRARSEIVNQVRKDIRNSSSSSSSHGEGDFRNGGRHHEREALKENNTNTKDGGVGFQSRIPSALFGGAQNRDGNDEQQRVAREKQRLEEKRRKAQMAETSLHEKMDETKERIMERGGAVSYTHLRAHETLR